MRRGILADRDEIKGLRKRILRSPFDTIYDRLRKRCSLILESAPVTEQRWRMASRQGHWASAILAAQTAQGRILDLLIAHHIDADAAYRDRAIEELKGLARWTTWLDPCHEGPADLCTGEAAVTAIVGLDWLWEDLGEADRNEVKLAIAEKALGPYLQGVRQEAFWYNCYHNWNAVVNGGCGLAALALADEDAAAEEALALARSGLKHYFDAVGHEGGWDEGTGYWAYGMRYALLFGLGLCRVLDDQSVFHHRGLDRTGLFPVYFTPNGHAASFGDAAGVPVHGAFYLLSRQYGLREMTWWLDTYAFHRDISATGWSAAGLALLLRPSRGRPAPAPHLKTVKVFDDVGWAAMADRWPRPQMYAALKTGDLAANHSHRDMNAIQLQVGGEMLLVDLGNPPYSREYFSQRRGGFREVQACGHNTITISECDHNIDAQGAIADSRNGRNYRYLLADAGDACGEGVRFYRHVTMVVDPQTKAGRMLIVLDELTCGTPEKADLFWHAGGEIKLGPKAMSGLVLGRRERLHFAFASTAQADVSSSWQRLSGRRVDRFVRLTAGVMGRAMFASVFSRVPLKEPIGLCEGIEGDVDLRVEGARLRLKPHHHCLRLERITTARRSARGRV